MLYVCYEDIHHRTTGRRLKGVGSSADPLHATALLLQLEQQTTTDFLRVTMSLELKNVVL